jgi:hypothetical protein
MTLHRRSPKAIAQWRHAQIEEALAKNLHRIWLNRRSQPYETTVKDLDLGLLAEAGRARRHASAAGHGHDEITIRKGRSYRVVVSDLDRGRGSPSATRSRGTRPMGASSSTQGRDVPRVRDIGVRAEAFAYWSRARRFYFDGLRELRSALCTASSPVRAW